MSASYVENDKPIWLKRQMTETTIVVNYFPNNQLFCSNSPPICCGGRVAFLFSCPSFFVAITIIWNAHCWWHENGDIWTLQWRNKIALKEEFEDTNGVIRIRISENRQYNGQKKKVQKDKQRSTKHSYKTKDRVTRTPQQTEGELMCSGWVGSSCSTSGTRRVDLVTNPVISHELGKDREVFTTSRTYPWSFVRYSISSVCYRSSMTQSFSYILGIY
jgi:hypothetical protein